MFTKCLNIHYIYDKTDTRVYSAQTTVRVCSNRQEERKSRTSQAAPNELKLGESR